MLFINHYHLFKESWAQFCSTVAELIFNPFVITQICSQIYHIVAPSKYYVALEKS